ncbi:tyrosine-type recombinase/integrase [Candidatus Thiodictyon syntrophicum]|nr:site-specific integrase [Candidatus Thiodictyon syntrophicum]
MKDGTWGAGPTFATRKVETVGDLFVVVRDRFWSTTHSAGHLTRNGQFIVDFFGEDTPITGITPARIREFTTSLIQGGNANATVNRKLAALSKMLTVADQEGLILKKPHIDRMKEAEGRMEWWTRDMERAAFDYCDWAGRADLKDFITVSLDTGMRTMETFRIKEQDLDWSMGNGILFVWKSKSGKARSVPLTTRAAEVYRRRLTGANGGRAFRWSVWSMRDQWRGLVAHLEAKGFLGIGSPHTLRHSFCSRLVQKGVPLLEVGKLAGHASMAVTMRYAKLAPNSLTHAISVLEED